MTSLQKINRICDDHRCGSSIDGVPDEQDALFDRRRSLAKAASRADHDVFFDSFWPYELPFPPQAPYLAAMATRSEASTIFAGVKDCESACKRMAELLAKDSAIPDSHSDCSHSWCVGNNLLQAFSPASVAAEASRKDLPEEDRVIFRGEDVANRESALSKVLFRFSDEIAQRSSSEEYGWPDDSVLGTPSFKFRYGHIAFDVPAEWWYAREATGPTLTKDDVLGAIWFDYLYALRSCGVDWSTIHALLGCFDIYRSDEAPQYLFWNTGWGPAHKVYLHMVAMVFAYSRFIDQYKKYDASEEHVCEGFGAFIRELLQNREAATHDVSDSKYSKCQLRIHFKAWDPRFLDEVVRPCDLGESWHCGAGYTEKGDLGTAWDKCGFYWVEGPNGPTWSAQDPETVSGVIPSPHWGTWYYETDAVSYCDEEAHKTVAIGGGFGVTMHPSRLALDAKRVDYALWGAQIALEYSRHVQEPSRSIYYNYAWWLGRYALRVISWYGRVLIHEMGHTYAGSNHCGSDLHCACFDIASRFWEAQVVAYLGLPELVSAPDRTRWLDNREKDGGGDSGSENERFAYSWEAENPSLPFADRACWCFLECGNHDSSDSCNPSCGDETSGQGLVVDKDSEVPHETLPEFERRART